MIMVMPSLSEAEDLWGSNNRAVSLYVVKPQFSIAPAWRSGTAARSVRYQRYTTVSAEKSVVNHSEMLFFNNNELLDLDKEQFGTYGLLLWIFISHI